MPASGAEATGHCRERYLLSGVHYNGFYDLNAGA